MDFILGSKETEKTTCLIEMANKFILENGINRNNGYVLLFTPKHSQNMDINDPNINNKRAKDYHFIQYLTKYMPNSIENMDLIKCYELSSASYAFGLIDNFRLLSEKSKGIKLILIDDITNIINPWINEIMNNKINSAKSEEMKNLEESNNNILFIYNEIFQYFLSKIISLQKCFQAQCFVSLNINISDHINFTKYSPKIFNAIFPYIRTSYYLSKLANENKIIFNEFRLALNTRNDKIEYLIIGNEEKDNYDKNIDEKDNDYILLKEFIDKKKKKNKNLKNAVSLEKVKSWMKFSIGEFVNDINNYKIFKEKLEEQNKIDKDFSGA